jgi:hypothetical protein
MIGLDNYAGVYLELRCNECFNAFDFKARLFYGFLDWLVPPRHLHNSVGGGRSNLFGPELLRDYYSRAGSVNVASGRRLGS